MRQAENELPTRVLGGRRAEEGRLGRISCAVEMIALAAYPLEPDLAL